MYASKSALPSILLATSVLLSGPELAHAQEVVLVPATGATVFTSSPLQAGVVYYLGASGTCFVGSGCGQELADAEYWFCNGVGMDLAGSGVDLGVSVDGAAPDWGAYQSSHEYGKLIVGTGSPASLRFLDSFYPDNSGTIQVRVEPFDCSPGQEVFGVETVRTGTPPNPNALLPGVSGALAIGSTWDPVVDHTTFMPSALIDFLMVSLAPVEIPTGFGTILCGPAALTLAVPAGSPFALALNDDCSLVGIPLCTQASSWDGTLPLNATSFGLTNALDVTIGTTP